MKFVPHDYQSVAIQAVQDKDSVGLFLDMGLGKSVITLTAIKNLKALEDIGKVLVIAPLQTARNTWTDEVEKWDHLKGLTVSLVLGSSAQRKEALNTEADIYVINRENVQWLCDFLPSWPFDMVVIDELSSFKSAQAKRFKALRKVIPRSRRVVGLTGTPAPNGYMDLWSEVYLLDRGQRLGRTLGIYRQSFFFPSKQNGHIVYEWKLQPFAKEAIDERLKDLCISMKAEDLLNLPERIDTEIYVTMDSKEQALYRQFGRDHILPQVSGDIVGLTAAAVQNKLLQMANGFAYDTEGNAVYLHKHKLTALSELCEAANGEPVLVFYSFVEDKQRILDEFPEAVELKGSKEVKDWNNGKIKMLLCHPASAGHGLNLQQGGRIIVWYGLPWSLELYQQANARLHRQGQKSTVLVYHILTRNTHDDDVLKALHQKDATQEQLLAALKARIEEWTNDTKRIFKQS